MYRSILALLLLSCTMQLSAQEKVDRIVFNKVLRIGITGNQPPYSMESKNGKLMGFEIDLGNRLGSAMGVEVKFVQLPFSELFPAMESDKIDIIMSGMTMTTARNLNVAFIGPYITTGKSILTKSEKLATITDLAELDLKKFSIGVLKGSTSEDFAKEFLPAAKLVTVDNYEEAIDMVRSEELTFMLADYAECLYASLRYSVDNLQILNRTLTNERIGIAIPAGDPLFINILQNFLGEVDENGELAFMESRWFQSGTWLMDMK